MRNDVLLLPAQGQTDVIRNSVMKFLSALPVPRSCGHRNSKDLHHGPLLCPSGQRSPLLDINRPGEAVSSELSSQKFRRPPPTEPLLCPRGQSSPLLDIYRPGKAVSSELWPQKVRGPPPRDPLYAPEGRAVHSLISIAPERPRRLPGRRVASPGQVRKCIAHHPPKDHFHQTLSWMWSR
ncbi:hypothetical protein AVEN_243421-1 [Araneus ventricosus]|uniref:Uncharacterized protein n=1 Tax=Araneus ventricosus TaxID=182803 RepID=A0A4Y2NVV0_ARAVE|nr:hypothetical protein AVEN_243421-1 [Araneus ventricosus]